METNTIEASYLNNYYNESVVHFDELFKDRSLKFVGVSFAFASMPIIFFLCYGIIWFERFGSGKSI
jgi:hypothetical protein